MKRHNLHTHTTYSDGENTPEELVRKSVEGGLEIIGISDHGFTRKIRSLNETNLPRYIVDHKKLRERTQGIDIKIGLEIDTCKLDGIEPSELPFVILNQLDYVLFEYVRGINSSPLKIYRCLESVVSVRRKLTIPVGLAHTNLDEDFNSNEDIARILASNNIFVEIPLNDKDTDVRFRYSPRFLEALRRYQVKFTIGTDIHSLESQVGNIEPAFRYIVENGLISHEMVC